MSEDMEFSDVSTGERVKCGARVDDGVYKAFRQWVEHETGKQYMEVGRALDRAMLEYMTDDKTREILNQTRKNEALLRKVIDKVEGEKVKETSVTTESEIPQGKDPGSRRQREAYVIQAVLANNPARVSRSSLEQLVREVAGVSTGRIVKDYVAEITDTAAFQPHQKASQWRFDPEGAREVLSKRGVPEPEAPT